LTCSDASWEYDSYCHLCYDIECGNCDGYTIDDCLNCGAGNSSGSPGSDKLCECDEGYGRPANSPDTLCDQCHDGCATCETGGVQNFSDCTACKSAKWQVSIDNTGAADDKVMCLDYCPDGYDEGSKPGCTFNDTNTKLFCLSFNDFDKSHE
jgi:hypothetical protein